MTIANIGGNYEGNKRLLTNRIFLLNAFVAERKNSFEVLPKPVAAEMKATQSVHLLSVSDVEPIGFDFLEFPNVHLPLNLKMQNRRRSYVSSPTC